MGKTTEEQERASVVKHGIGLLLLGIPPKLIYFFIYSFIYLFLFICMYVCMYVFNYTYI